MESFFYLIAVVFVGGLLGTVAMDVAKYIGHKLKLIGGVRMDMLGRWALGMLKGVMVYKDIHDAPAYKNENMAGWVFHYLTGGLVAMVYPVFLNLLGTPVTESGLILAVAFGLTTSVLPWFVVYPAFGKGFFGSRAPKASRPVITSIVSHAFYGAGIGVVVVAAI
jgi:hypothetical protein